MTELSPTQARHTPKMKAGLYGNWSNGFAPRIPICTRIQMFEAATPPIPITTCQCFQLAFSARSWKPISRVIAKCIVIMRNVDIRYVREFHRSDIIDSNVSVSTMLQGRVRRLKIPMKMRSFLGLRYTWHAISTVDIKQKALPTMKAGVPVFMCPTFTSRVAWSRRGDDK